MATGRKKMNSGLSSFFEKIGLTEYEAKTLTALFRLKESEVPEISRIAQVPKTRVYDVLENLTRRGLIIEIYGRPKKYKVVDVHSAFDELIQAKKTEVAELEKQAIELKESFKENGGMAEEAKEKVMKVKDRADFMKILAQEIGSAQKQVIALTQLGPENELIKESIRKAHENNVEVKLISKINASTKKICREYYDMGVGLRDYEHGLNAFVIDGKKVVMALTDFSEEKPEYHFTIWKDHPHMARALQSYFNECWKAGKGIQ